MSDLFQDAVPDEAISQIWSVMRNARWHTFQILTKRPERMRELLSHSCFRLPNVWLGTSVENSSYLDRIDVLRVVPASVRFVSFEPLLGPVAPVDLTGIHWAIVGGESGPGARPMARQWVENIRAVCQDQNVAFFFKQWGGTRKSRNGRLLDGRTWDEYPLIQGGEGAQHEVDSGI
jgi:protein gp37